MIDSFTRKALSRPGAFLVTHHPVGALDYKVVVIACHDLEMINLPGVVRLHLENGSLQPWIRH